MFSTSTQRKCWIFPDDVELSRLREEANAAYIRRHDGLEVQEFLSVQEETILVKHAEMALKAFCQQFKPPMPANVVTIAVTYLKRVYLKHSVMDYRPLDIIPTCVFLACKVDEFNVSLRQFVSNLRKDREKTSDSILWFELPLMQILNFQLTVHTPYRSMEGLFINLKTHCPEVDVEALRPEAMAFLDRILFTDACFLYAPSQISLAAIIHSANECRINLKYFLTEHFMRGASSSQVDQLFATIADIMKLPLAVEKSNRSQIKVIEQKLEKCGNQEFNPSSSIFRKRMKEFDEDDDQHQLKMYEENSQDQHRMEQELLLK